MAANYILTRVKIKVLPFWKLHNAASNKNMPMKSHPIRPLFKVRPNSEFCLFHMDMQPGRVAQSVTCLAADASLTADPGVASSIPARSNTFVEIDHEITSTVILLPSAESFKKGCCQLQAKVCARSSGQLLVQAV